MDPAEKGLGGRLPASRPAGSAERRSCARCGAEHVTTAPYCWRCFAPRPGIPRTSSNAAQGQTLVAQPARIRFTLVEPATRPRRARFRMPAGAPAAAGAVGIVVLFAMLLRTPAYALPDSVGAVPRLASPQVATLEDSWRDGFDDQGLKGDLGIYGTAATPSFVVFAYEDRPASAEEALRRLARVWLHATGTRVAISSVSTHDDGGNLAACAPFAGSSFRAICAWIDGQGFVGSVASFDAGLAETRERMHAARLALAA